MGMIRYTSAAEYILWANITKYIDVVNDANNSHGNIRYGPPPPPALGVRGDV